LSKDNDSAKELIQVLDAECGGGEFDGISIIQERLTDLMLTDDEHVIFIDFISSLLFVF
jgi:hypothetical protein